MAGQNTGASNPPQTQLRVDYNKAWTVANSFVSGMADKDRGSFIFILFEYLHSYFYELILHFEIMTKHHFTHYDMHVISFVYTGRCNVRK